MFMLIWIKPQKVDHPLTVSREIETDLCLNLPEMSNGTWYSSRLILLILSQITNSVLSFTITAEIHALSLDNSYSQCADRHMNLKFMRRVSKRARAIPQFVIVLKKLMSVFLCVFPVIDNEFRHKIVKVVCGSTWLSPLRFPATSTLLWGNFNERTEA